MDAIDAVRRDRGVLFWYDAKDPHASEFDSINSLFLWGYTWISRDFPALAGDPGNRMTGDVVVAVLSSEPSADSILEKARRSLLPYRLTADLIEANRIDYRGVAYNLAMLKARRI